MKRLVEMIEDKKLAFKKDDDLYILGKLVEMEHVHNFPNMNAEKVAEMIAADHLKQDEMYYIKLINAGLVDESEAIKFYNDVIKLKNYTDEIGEE